MLKYDIVLKNQSPGVFHMAKIVNGDLIYNGRYLGLFGYLGYPAHDGWRIKCPKCNWCKEVVGRPGQVVEGVLKIVPAVEFLTISPWFAICLFLDGFIREEHIKEALVVDSLIIFSGLKFQDKILEVVVVNDQTISLEVHLAKHKTAE